MADHRITDFVDQSAIDGLNRLKEEMKDVKDTYIQVAQEIVKGLKVPVDNLDQLERMTRSLAELQQQAAAATQRHSSALDEQNRIAANTTNTISRQLMEQEKLNEKTRDAYTRQNEVKAILSSVVTSYSDMTRRIAEITVAQSKLTEEKKKEDKAYKDGKITYDQYCASLQSIIARQEALAAEKSQLQSYTRSEAKENQNATSSYNAMSQELARLKKAYRELDEESRNAEVGQSMLAEIKELGAHLKDMDASMGDFQRNVGDYAIACSNGVVVTDDLNRVLELNAGTVAGCIEQNRELEKAKLSLNVADADYEQSVNRINQKIEENKRRILDVDGILAKEATTVAEAETQNKQLAEALKLIDLKSEGAEQRIKQLNDKIAENKRIIEQATPALQDQAKASEGLADKMLSILGVNKQFGTSLKGLADTAGQGGNLFEGLGIKVKAFGKTLLGLLANPYVLALLGIGGAVAGFKWWYDYNKGLAEATRLTKDFTGKSGDDLKNLQAEIQGVADTYGKDFRDMLNATDKMASQLGITYEEALAAIKDGFIANADAQGTFLSNVEKFSPALRDAGLNARELVAVISQTRSGVFSEDGLKAIQVASDRIKRMPKATQEALAAIGMSSSEIQTALESGSKSMMDVIQEVSAKLKEIPQNSEAYGDAIYNVFGRKAAAGGALLIESLADINTNLDAEKDKMGELGRLQEEQMESQIKLEKTLSAVFNATGGSFESMTTMAKTFINNGIVKIIEGCVDIVNWFIRLYNKSMLVRGAFNSIVLTFKQIWNVGKFVINQISAGFKALGDVIEGILTLNPDKIAAGYKRTLNALKANITEFVKSSAKDMSDAINDTLNGEMKEVSIDFKADGGGTTSAGGGKRTGGGGGSGGSGSGGGSSSKAKSEAEKAAKEEIKRLNDLEEAKLKAMSEGHEKEIAQIRFNYNKKIREITGDNEKEKAARKQLVAAMNKELAECEEKYQAQLSEINLANRLESVEKGSKLEADLKIKQLENAREKEIKEAEKTGADVELINAKYAMKKKELLEAYADEQNKKIQERYGYETIVAENEYQKQMNALKDKYVEEMKAANGNASKQEKIRQKYEEDVSKLSESYAEATVRTSIKMYKEILKNQDMSADERKQIESDLAKAEMELETEMADHAISEMERVQKKDDDFKGRRWKNAQLFLQAAASALNAINDLASAIYDADIERIESKVEANDEANEKEQESISELVEQKVITEEEGEARKRAAEAKTAKKNEELEKKKQELQYKQAVWDKTNGVAQAGISTALAIMQALASTAPPASWALAALAGATGAIQIATILATPIPKYAKGTDYHMGGLAVVGDGGKNEIVSFGGQMYLTPDKPTLIDMPRGAEVIPDADMLLASNADLMAGISKMDTAPSVVVNNDYTDLKREVAALGVLIKKQTKAQSKQAYRNEYEMFKIAKGL